MDNSTLTVASSFLLFLSLALAALFVHLILSARKDAAAIIARLLDSNNKLLRMQHSADIRGATGIPGQEDKEYPSPRIRK